MMLINKETDRSCLVMVEYCEQEVDLAFSDDLKTIIAFESLNQAVLMHVTDVV